MATKKKAKKKSEAVRTSKIKTKSAGKSDARLAPVAEANPRRKGRATVESELEAKPQPAVETKLAPKSPLEIDVCSVEWLKWCGKHLEEKPFENRRLGIYNNSPEASCWREYLMYALLKIRSKGGTLQELLLNRAQQDLERSSGKRNIVLKARQLGVTTYVAARFFLNSITREGTLSVQVAHDQRSAEEIFRIVHRLLENLPAELRKDALVTSRANVRQIVFPVFDSEYRVETAADDSVQTAWQGEYQTTSDSLTSDVMPGNTVQVSAPSRGAVFNAIVREVELQVMSLRDDLSQYKIKFANDAAEPLAFQADNITLPTPLTTIFNVNTPSSALYIASLTAAQITNVIATEITVDAGVAPPAGGGIEVRRSDGGWGPSDSGNLAGRFTTQTFVLPRLARVQGYYLRQYDGSTPPKYSRYSTLLHVDYPL